MTSRITIEVDFENNNQPMIRIIEDRASDDVRDKLLGAFRQKIGYDGSWLKIKFINDLMLDDGKRRYNIYPIAPEELEAESVAMAEQAKLISGNKAN